MLGGLNCLKRRDNWLAGSSVAGMVVGTVFIVIFASATVTMVDIVNKAQLAAQVELPDPEMILVSVVWDEVDTLTYTITNTGSEAVKIEHIFLSEDNADPFSCSTLTRTPSLTYIFPGETISAVEAGLGASPSRAFLVVFEYSSSVAVTT